MNKNIYELIKYLIIELELNTYSVSSFTRQYVETIIEATSDMDVVGKNEIAVLFSELSKEKFGILSVYLASAINYLKNDEDSVLNILNCTYDNREYLGVDSVYNIWQQVNSRVFVSPECDTEKTFSARVKLYKWVMDQYECKMSDLIKNLKNARGKEGFVVVLTDQQIDYQHGPSKSSVDRCKTLIKSGKRVLLINTAELLSPVGQVPFVGCQVGNYKDELLEADHLDWKGVSIPFFQCERNMPNPRTMIELLTTIGRLSPEYVVAIGGSGILTGLVSKIFPTLCVGMCPSMLSISECRFQTFSGCHDEVLKSRLKILGLNDNSVIDSFFVSSLKPQTQKHTRAELGIAEDVFLIAIIGGRLNSEISNSFIDVLIAIKERNPNVEYLIMGEYSPNEIINRQIGNCFHVLGMVEDVLSFLELCDLYINPIRRGGGTSSVEAMSKGVPVVTTPYGDVSVNTGEKFWVEGYDCYPDAVYKYRNDINYYKFQSETALVRSKRLLDSEVEFIKTIMKFEERIGLV